MLVHDVSDVLTRTPGNTHGTEEVQGKGGKLGACSLQSTGVDQRHKLQSDLSTVRFSPSILYLL